MTAGELTDVIERTLREHRHAPDIKRKSPHPMVGWVCMPVAQACDCGWQGDDHARHVAEAVTAAITEHAEVEEEWVSRTIIRFPWKDVTTDEH